MLTSFRPTIEGTAAVQSPGPQFIGAFARQVENGLLGGAPARRWHYEVTAQERDRLRFRARDWSTALNVGLNVVDVAALPDGRVRYKICFVRWAGYSLALGAVIGLVLIAFLVAPGLRTYLLRSPGVASLGLSPQQNLGLAWGMALFWGFGWPWILIALHKKPLQRLMQRLIAEVDASATRA